MTIVKDMTKGDSLTPEQQRLNRENIARLQRQRIYGNEKPPNSLLDLIPGNVPRVKRAVAIPLQRIL
jgi:hypothetical protein